MCCKSICSTPLECSDPPAYLSEGSTPSGEYNRAAPWTAYLSASLFSDVRPPCTGTSLVLIIEHVQRSDQPPVATRRKDGGQRKSLGMIETDKDYTLFVSTTRHARVHIIAHAALLYTYVYRVAVLSVIDHPAQ